MILNPCKIRSKLSGTMNRWLNKMPKKIIIWSEQKATCLFFFFLQQQKEQFQQLWFVQNESLWQQCLHRWQRMGNALASVVARYLALLFCAWMHTVKNREMTNGSEFIGSEPSSYAEKQFLLLRFSSFVVAGSTRPLWFPWSRNYP